MHTENLTYTCARMIYIYKECWMRKLWTQSNQNRVLPFVYLVIACDLHGNLVVVGAHK